MVKTVAGFGFLMLVLGLALFGAAGTVDFWQAWAYLGVFAGCTVLITAYLARHDRRLLASRVKAGPAAEKQRGQQALQSLASAFFLALYVVAGLDRRWGWSAVPPAVSAAACGFVALGFGIVFLVFRENSFSRATIELSDEQTVIDSGPYRFVRHPMYAGAALLLLFTPPALGSWVAVPLPLPLIAVVVARLLAEERFLRAGLEGYEAYCGRVRRRLVPFVW